jgi:uncharacterized membrane protein YfcA
MKLEKKSPNKKLGLLKDDSGNLGGIVFVTIFALVLLAVGGYMMFKVTNTTEIPDGSKYADPVNNKLPAVFGDTTEIVGLFIVIVLIAGALGYFSGIFNGGGGARM